MKIGIVQVDGKTFPNLALMQICGYHEQLGDTVEWYQGPLFDDTYDKIYASKIFSFSEWPKLPARTIKGGTGVDWKNKLPPEMYDAKPSYTLYPECNYHIGFSMKGCRFKCDFCVVPVKEGRPRENSTIDQLLINPNGGNKLMLLDNDFFGGPAWEANLNRMIELNLKVSFVQGINIRYMPKRPDQARLLSKVRYYDAKFNDRKLSFAWDRYNDGALIKESIAVCNEAGIPTNRMKFFVLIGFDTTHEQNYERVMTLDALGAEPYVMPYDKSTPYQRAFRRWVNRRHIFKSTIKKKEFWEGFDEWQPFDPERDIFKKDSKQNTLLKPA